MSRTKATKLRPAEGGRFHAPVGPSAELVALIRDTDDSQALRDRRRLESAIVWVELKAEKP